MAHPVRKMSRTWESISDREKKMRITSQPDHTRARPVGTIYHGNNHQGVVPPEAFEYSPANKAPKAHRKE